DGISGRICGRSPGGAVREAGVDGDHHSPNPCCEIASSTCGRTRITQPLDEPLWDTGSHDQYSCGRRVCPAETLDPVLERRGCRAEVHDEDLVLDRIDLATQSRPELGEFALVQVAEKDAVLYVVALALQRLEDSVAAAIVGDGRRQKEMPARQRGQAIPQRVLEPGEAGNTPGNQAERRRARRRIHWPHEHP